MDKLKLYDGTLTSILKRLESKDTKEINEGIELVEELLHEHIDEKWGRREGKGPTRLLDKLLDKLLIMARHSDWQVRYAAIRAIGRLGFSDVANKKIGIIAELILGSLQDEDGRVRYASVHALNSIRLSFPGDLYVEFYLLLQDMYDLEDNDKKRRTIDQALGALYCPYLETLFHLHGYSPIEEIGG